MAKSSYIHPLLDIEAALTSVFEATDTPLVAVSRSGDLLLLNWRMQAITGFAAGQELQTRFLETTMAEEERASLLIHVEHMLGSQSAESEQASWTFKTKGGEERSMAFSAVPLRDPTGAGIGVLYIGRRGRPSLKSYDRQPIGTPTLKDHDENISSLVFSIDVSNGRITAMNQASAYLLGYYPSDFHADPKLLSARVLPEYHEAFEAALVDARRGVARSIEVGFARRDNDTVILAMMLYPGRDRQGGVISVEGIGRDITARKEAEQQLAESLEELQAAYDRLQAQHEELQSLDRLKSQVLANVSHELRTPLVTIRGYNELLLQEEMGKLNDRQRKGLEISAKSIQRLLTLIENLIDFARLEKDRYRLSRDYVDLGALLTEVVGETADTMREKNLKVELDLGKAPAIVLGDRTRLKQAFRNLVDNAEKFSDPSGTIRLQLTRDDDGIVTRISDTGIGIPAEEQDKIFDTFYQVDGSSTRPYPGLGIGLAIVREIIELHGGSIEVESEMGEGARFVVHLPHSEQREIELAAAQTQGETEPATDDPDAMDDAVTDAHPEHAGEPDPSLAPRSGEIDTARNLEANGAARAPEEAEEGEGDYGDDEEGTTEFQPTRKYIARVDLKKKTDGTE